MTECWVRTKASAEWLMVDEGNYEEHGIRRGKGKEEERRNVAEKCDVNGPVKAKCWPSR
jgi:hypothetical protein